MVKFKTLSVTLCILLLALLCIGLAAPAAAFAVPVDNSSILTPPPGQEEEEGPKETLELTCQYPALKNPAGSIFEYEVQIAYKNGEEPKYFDITADVPDGFYYKIEKSYGGAEIPGLTLDPAKAYTPEKIKVSVVSFVDPGEYPITLRAFSEDLSKSIELKAIVTAVYKLEITTPDGRLNTEATANKESLFTMIVTNTGTDVLEQIKFSSSIRGAPSGWDITFDPKEIDTLPVGVERDVKVAIKPPQKTISGDYEINLSAEPDKKYDVKDDIDVRVTVVTATIWGWVGVGIVVLVVIGLVVMFLRLGRR
jgi:uncharacterized membrane protein